MTVIISSKHYILHTAVYMTCRNRFAYMSITTNTQRTSLRHQTGWESLRNKNFQIHYNLEITIIHWVRHGLSCWNIHYVDFSDCLFLLNNICLKFLRVFLGPSVFIFVILNYSRCLMCLFICFGSWLNLRIWAAMNVCVFSGNEIVSHLTKYQGIW